MLPLLNGLDHLAVLRRRFAAGSVLAGAIRVEADRPQPGVVVHTSPFLRVDMAAATPPADARARELAALLSDAGIPARVLDSEAEVMWSKLVRLNALACMTSAYDKLLGEIRSTPAAAGGPASGRSRRARRWRARRARTSRRRARSTNSSAPTTTLGSSMQRDIAAGRPPELDAIPGSVLRAAARHGLPCPTIERLVEMIGARLDVTPAG